jgi:alkylation response protein AidB-like acyl-CoA dehydrogenase
MQFAFTPEQAMIADVAGQFFADMATSERTRAAMAGDGIDRDLWRAFADDVALAGVALPEANGGAGLGLVEMAIIVEAAGRHVAALPLLSSLGLAAPAILAAGSEEQRARWLPPIGRGEIIAAVAELEQSTIAGGRISGIAPRVAHGASADLIVAVAEDQFWLVKRSDAVTIAVQTSMDQTRPLARLTFDEAEADPIAESAAALSTLRRWGWTLIAADALGGAQTCLDRTAAYALERSQFGRPIGTFQAVKHALADVAVEVEQARSAVYWAAAEHEDSPDAMLAAHAAKAVACQAYSNAAAAMIQLHGGIGFTWEHDAHLFFKRARANRNWMGTPEWHLDQVAALMPLGDAE